MISPDSEGGPAAFVFGTMRLHSTGAVDVARDLILRALDAGVDAFHVSSEYESWPFFVQAWTAVRRDRDVDGVRFIGKIGVPHFGETAFGPQAFEAKVEAYRSALGLDRLAVAQWLLRYDLKDEPGRLDIFDRDQALVADTVAALKADGRLGAVASFPYTRGVAERAAAADWCDGLAIYVNRLETELTPLLDRLAAKPLGAIAIRPFGAGRVFEELGQTPADALRYAADQANVRYVVASVSSPAHLDQAVAALSVSRPGTDV